MNTRRIKFSSQDINFTTNLLTLIKYVDFRATLKRVRDDFVGRGHYTRNYTSALIIP